MPTTQAAASRLSGAGSAGLASALVPDHLGGSQSDIVFASFFPKPAPLFWTALAWAALSITLWFGDAGELGTRWA